LDFKMAEIWTRSGMRDQLFLKCPYHLLTISEVKMRVHFRVHTGLIPSSMTLTVVLTTLSHYRVSV